MTAATVDGRLLCACELAYQSDQSIYRDGVGFQSPPAFCSSGSNACLIGKNQDGIIVAFRGTLPIDDRTKPFSTRLLDWCVDFDAVLVKDKNLPGLVHAGFDDAVNSLWQWIVSTVQRLDASSIYFTGHSKGGAMAALATMRWLHEFFKIPNVVTFGSARPGDVDFATEFQANIVTCRRWENRNDIVPYLPPSLPFSSLLVKASEHLFDELDYRSVGSLSYIDGRGEITTPTSMAAAAVLESERLADLGKMFLTVDLDDILEDHYIDLGSGYQRAIAPEIGISVI